MRAEKANTTTEKSAGQLVGRRPAADIFVLPLPGSLARGVRVHASRPESALTTRSLLKSLPGKVHRPAG